MKKLMPVLVVAILGCTAPPEPIQCLGSGLVYCNSECVQVCWDTGKAPGHVSVIQLDDRCDSACRTIVVDGGAR